MQTRSRSRTSRVLVTLSSLMIIGCGGGGGGPEGTSSPPALVRVSVDSAGREGDHRSFDPAISGGGRWVAFVSRAASLVADDTNAEDDIFVHDRDTGETTRVSVPTGGGEAHGDSASPAISADGRWVAFQSVAVDLIAGDANGVSDVFLHDRENGTTTRISVATGGFEATGDSSSPAISADGRWVAFESAASDLVAADTNSAVDVFVHDRESGETTRVSVATGGLEATGDSGSPAISDDGRWVAFVSTATNLVAGDANGRQDVFVHDRTTGETTRVSVATGGGEATGHSFAPAVSADGRWIAFDSAAPDMVTGDTNGLTRDVFVHDRQTGETTRVSVDSTGAEADDGSFDPTISADGQRIAFRSYAGNLVANDTNNEDDIFAHDRDTGQTVRVSVAPGGAESFGNCDSPVISTDGQWVAFQSSGTDLVPDDTSSLDDIFLAPVP